MISPGSIYFNCVGGIHIAIPFKEESGEVLFIMSDVLNDEVYFTTDANEFIERYTLYQVFNKPNNEEAFDELVNKTKERYDKMRRKLIMSDINEIKTYICITLDLNTRFIDVIDVCNTIEDGKTVCMKHMDALATDDGHVDEIRYTKWESTKADTGICIKYSFYDREDNPKGSGILFVIEFVRDLQDVMNRLKDIKTLNLDPTGPITHVKPNSEYMEYNFRYLSTKIHNGEESVVINADEFRHGSPYIIMKDNGRVLYGIAAYGNNDEMVFITTIDDPKDKNFGKPIEITITAKDLCSKVKIKYIGMIKGELL